MPRNRDPAPSRARRLLGTLAGAGSRHRFRLSRTTVAKLLGLAGLAGVAASGAVVTRAERRRRAYTPDEVRARLRERAAAAQAEPRP